MTLPINETALVSLCLRYLLYQGHIAWRNNTGGMRKQYTSKRTGLTRNSFVKFSERGAPDIMGIEKGTGRFIGIECKVGSNKPTECQQEWLEAARAAGAIVHVIYDVDELMKVL